jgi:hypothetical protein
MLSKWAGRCKACGIAIPPGTQIDWTKDGGARHVTPADCEAARLVPPPVETPLRGPGVELPEERARVEHLLLSHPWKTASTMPRLPHSYTLRRLWLNDEDFIWAVEYIRRVGYEGRFVGRVFTYIDVAEHQYWSCDGDPRSTDPRTTVGLINRALLVRPAMGRRTRQGPSTL